MNLLDRHIFRSVLLTTVAAMCLFAFVLMAGNILRDLMGPMLSGQLQLLTFVRLVLLLLPFVIYYALPLGVLTGVLLTLGRLSSDSEVTAMRAAGISIPRIAAPVFGLALIGALAGLRINFESMPWSRIQYHREFAAAMRANPLSFIRPRTFIREFPGYVVYVGSMDGSAVHDFWLWQLDAERRVVRFVRAESGSVDYDEATNAFVVKLERARIEEHDRAAADDFTQPLRINSFGEIDPFRLSLARYFGVQTVHQKLPWMTYRELIAEKARILRERVPPGGAAAHEHSLLLVSLTIQDKLNMAVAVIAFALVGVPLGIKVSRRETSANLGIAVLLALAYYCVIDAIKLLDNHPEFHPEVLLWLPNIAFVGLGLWLLGRLDRA